MSKFTYSCSLLANTLFQCMLWMYNINFYSEFISKSSTACHLRQPWSLKWTWNLQANTTTWRQMQRILRNRATDPKSNVVFPCPVSHQLCTSVPLCCITLQWLQKCAPPGKERYFMYQPGRESIVCPLTRALTHEAHEGYIDCSKYFAMDSEK